MTKRSDLRGVWGEKNKEPLIFRVRRGMPFAPVVLRGPYAPLVLRGNSPAPVRTLGVNDCPPLGGIGDENRTINFAVIKGVGMQAHLSLKTCHRSFLVWMELEDAIERRQFKNLHDHGLHAN